VTALLPSYVQSDCWLGHRIKVESFPPELEHSSSTLNQFPSLFQSIHFTHYSQSHFQLSAVSQLDLEPNQRSCAIFERSAHSFRFIIFRSSSHVKGKSKRCREVIPRDEGSFEQRLKCSTKICPACRPAGSAMGVNMSKRIAQHARVEE
jgi:hypothetical protein